MKWFDIPCPFCEARPNMQCLNNDDKPHDSRLTAASAGVLPVEKEKSMTQTVCPICGAEVEHLTVCENGHSVIDMRNHMAAQRSDDLTLLATYGLVPRESKKTYDTYYGYEVAAVIRRILQEKNS